MQASNSVALNTCVGSYGNEINPAVLHDSSAKVNSSASDHDMEEKSSDDKTIHTDHAYVAEQQSRQLQQSPLPELLKSYKRRHGKTFDLRRTDASKRTEICHQWNTLQNTVRRLEITIDSMTRKKPKGSRNNNDVETAIGRKVNVKARRAMEMLISQLRDVEVLMDELEESSLQIQRAERHFEDVVRAMYAAIDGKDLQGDADDWSDVSVGTSSSVLSSPSRESAPPQDPNLEQYFDAVGTLHVVHERWADLHIEKQEQEERRLLMTDQGQMLEQSDEQFERSWQKHFENAEQALHRAWEVVEAAVDLCSKKDIEIPLWAKVEFPNIGVADPIHELQNSERGNVESFETPVMDAQSSDDAQGVTDVTFGDVSLLPTPHIGKPLVGERIAVWVTDVEAEPPDSRLRHAENREETAGVDRLQSSSVNGPHRATIRKVKSLSSLQPSLLGGSTDLRVESIFGIPRASTYK